MFITDVDLFELAIDQGIDIVETSANGDAIFNHDMVVKEIDGMQVMLVSYWDAGYIKLDVSDPQNPTIIGDSDFGVHDPIMKHPGTNTPWSRPEGNGHQAEFSHDNQFVLAADEDFATHRFLGKINPGAAGRRVHGRRRHGRSRPAPCTARRSRRSARWSGHALRRQRVHRGEHPGRHGGRQDRRRRAVRLQLPGQDRERRGQGLHGRDHLLADTPASLLQHA